MSYCNAIFCTVWLQRLLPFYIFRLLSDVWHKDTKFVGKGKALSGYSCSPVMSLKQCFAVFLMLEHISLDWKYSGSEIFLIKFHLENLGIYFVSSFCGSVLIPWYMEDLVQGWKSVFQAFFISLQNNMFMWFKNKDFILFLKWEQAKLVAAGFFYADHAGQRKVILLWNATSHNFSCFYYRQKLLQNAWPNSKEL